MSPRTTHTTTRGTRTATPVGTSARAPRYASPANSHSHAQATRPAATPAPAAASDSDDDAPVTTRPQRHIPRSASDPLATPIIISPDEDSVIICFDGGFRNTEGSWGVYVSKTIYFFARLAGHPSSFSAESAGALNALRTALNILRSNPHVRRVEIRGDNHSVIMSLAERSEYVKAQPGRSHAPGTWLAIANLRKELDELLAARDLPTDLSFLWLPRRFNAFADHLCNAALDRKMPTFAGCATLQPPESFGEPGPAELAAISERAIRGTLRSPWRSIAQAHKRLWHSALATICSWEHAELALPLAAAVLLQRHGAAPSEHFQRISSQPAYVKQLFWHAAQPPDDEPQAAHAASTPETRWERINNMAAHKPAKAVRMLDEQPAASPTDAAASVKARLDKPHQQLPDVPAKPPTWIKVETVIAAVARSPRAVAPGPDGWTRETFLMSFCRPTAPLFERIINGMARDCLSPWLAALIRAVRLACWLKGKTRDHRIVGMSSTLAKTVWRILTAQHIATHNLGKSQALFTKGGIFGVVRWVHESFLAGKPIIMDDVVDAYWSVDRTREFMILVNSHSPLALMFRMIYGTPAACSHGPLHLYFCGAGIIPGCGGASLLFAIDMHATLHSVDAPTQMALYADDVTTTSIAKRAAVCAALAPRKLAKTVALHKDGAHVLPEDLRHFWRPAARVLGGYVGEVEAAAALLLEDIQARLAKIDKIINATDNQLTPQSKFAMMRSIELSIRWKWMATHPSITCRVAEFVDERLVRAISSLCVAGTHLNHKSRSLITTPSATGGLGVVSFALQGPTLYDIASTQAPWPPQKIECEDGHVKRGMSSKQIGDALLEALPLPTEEIGVHELNARSDKSTPWFKIVPVVKYLAIEPAAWRLALTNFLRCDLAYPTCGAHDPTYDASQTCHRCGGPYRFARHQAVLHAIQRSCSRFGILASEQFGLGLGVTPRDKRPDLIIYRSIVDQPPLVIDVSVPHVATYHDYNAPLKAWNAKQDKYDTWKSDVVEFTPFIISTFAHIHPRTLEKLHTLSTVACNRGFVQDCISRVKVALANFEIYRRKALLVRLAAGTLASDPALEEPE